ncbi:MAG: radical SAM protein [Candidatus Omnitrophica bacterium]|nr:radical SAM protein [Candidatus Omnitrophota bacterium]
MNLITPFDPWQSKLCTCPTKYSLSAYTGCSHGCLYCYASSYIRKFDSPRPKKDFLKKLETEVKKITPGSTITIANSSDPYQSLEKKLQLTRKTLEILKNYDLKINLVTKSSLILRDIKILEAINRKQRIVACISLTTPNEKLAKKLEPGASTVKERLKTIKLLAKKIPIAVRLDPLIYPLTTEKIEDMIKNLKTVGAKQIITSTYKTKPDNFKKMIAGFNQFKKLWEELYLKQGQRKNQYIYLPFKIRKELIEKVRNVTLSYGLKFSSCREGFEELNTSGCDGSSFLE